LVRACTGTGACNVSMTQAQFVTANFTAIYALTVSKSGTGAGTVTSDPAGVSCGSSCSASYVSGTSVTLTAVPAAGSLFGGWSGECSGTGSCTVSMTAAHSVVANFIATYPLTRCRRWSRKRNSHQRSGGSIATTSAAPVMLQGRSSV